MGFVRNKSNKRLLKGTILKSGYIKLQPKKDDGTPKNIKVDEIICRIFFGPPSDDSDEVIHINGNTLDSNINNIRWGRSSEKSYIDKLEYHSSDYIADISLPNEEWRDCSPFGFIGYLASSFGRIYSLKKGKILTGTVHSNGYNYVGIVCDGLNKKIQAHTLVCHALDFHIMKCQV